MSTLKIENGEVFLIDGQTRTLVAILTSGAEATAQQIVDCWNYHQDLQEKRAELERSLALRFDQLHESEAARNALVEQNAALTHANSNQYKAICEIAAVLQRMNTPGGPK